MQLTIDHTKLKLIELLMSINDSQTLAEIEKEAERIKEKTTTLPNLQDAIKPARSNLTLTQIMEEQNYQPVSYVEFRAVADEFVFEESIDELLELLTK